MQHLFFEKSVNSFGRLMEEVGRMDLDSGIRTFGDYGGKKGQFVFITRSAQDGYTLMVCEKESHKGKPVPGKRLLVKEFRSEEKLGEFLQALLSRPLRAFIY